MEHILHCLLAVLAGITGFCLTIFDLPGNTFMLASIFAFSFLTEHFPGPSYLFMTLFVYLAGEIWEAGMSFFGIKKEHVSWGAVFFIGIGGFIGTIIGTGMFPILGSFLGGVVGAYIAAFLFTYIKTRSKDNAFHIAWASAKIRFLAMLGKLAAGITLAILLINLVLNK